jgi:tetratricopeptide (TPR) repeat protein
VAAVAAATPLVGNDPMALTALGTAVFQSLADLDRAAAYVDEALWLDPNNAWAWSRSGWIDVYRDRPEPAKKSLQRALTLSPLDPLEHNFRMAIACATALEGEFATAATMAQRVLDKNANITWAYRHVIAYSALAGDVAAAHQATVRLQAANPGFPVTMTANHPLRRVSRLYDVLAKGWRLAGLPEA